MMLQDNAYTFRVKVDGEKTRQTFEGTFVVKCLLTQAELVEVAIKTELYNGGVKDLPIQFQLINRSIAELEVRVVRDKTGKPLCPSFWSDNWGKDLYDSNVVYEVFSAAMKAEEDWYKRLGVKVDKTEVEAKEEKAKAEEKQAKEASA